MRARTAGTGHLPGASRGAPPTLRRNRGGGVGHRRSAVVAATLAMLALLVVPRPIGAQDRAPQEVTVRPLAAPTWVGADATWVLDLAVEGAPEDATVEGSLYERLDDREELDATKFGVLEGDRLATIPAIDLAPSLAAVGGGTAARLSLSLGDEAGSAPGQRSLPYDLSPGVYPVEAEVVDDDGETLARQVLYLNRVPTGDETAEAGPPLLVAPVLALEAPPSTAPEDLVGVADSAEALALTGDLPTTLVPRPETIEALASRPEGVTALDALARSLGTRQVVDGPYVDVALDAWAARGLQAELTRQRERGNSVLTQSLRRVDSSTWLARDGLTPVGAAELWSVGVRAVILGPGATVDGPPGTEQDDGRDGADDGPGPVTVSAGPSRRLEALVADAGLAGALDRSLLDGGPPAPALDDNRLAAELAVIAQSADAPAGVVLMPPERWPADPTAVGRLADLLGDPRSPVRPVTAADLLDAVDSRGMALLTPGPVADLGSYPERIALARSRLDSYTGLVGVEDPQVAVLGEQLLLSGARSLAPPERRTDVETVLAALDDGLEQVEAPAEQTIRLTARDADIPLTLRNQLDVPVTVLIEMQSDSRVEFRGEGARILRQLQPGDQEIRIPIHTRVPGDAPIDITVRTPDGVVALDQVEYTVRSTAISGVGFVLSIGAAAFLLLWWARHWTRDRRRRAGAETDAAPSTAT